MGDPTRNPRQIEFMTASTRYVAYGGARGGGKAQPEDEPVLTPFGFRQMKDIKVGSKVCTPDGGISTVIQEHPQGMQPVYKITFIDGAYTRVTAEHLWLVNKTTYHKGFHIADTKTLIKSFEKSKNSNMLIPLTNPVVFTRAKLGINIKPYTLGALLGDGCLVANNQLIFTTNDTEIIDNIREDGYTVSASIKKNDTYSCRVLNCKKERIILKKWNLLVKSEHKYIPEGYKHADINTRMELLRGLMDTDGYADSRGHVEFSTVSSRLAEDVQWLIRSIGGKATIQSQIGKYKKDGQTIECQRVYRIYIQTKQNSELFKLERKRKRCTDTFNGGASELCRRIKSIEPDGEAECKCITIDNPSGLYITRDFIVTHNSFAARYKAVGLCLKWEGIKVLLIRRTLKMLRGNHTNVLKRVFNKWPKIVQPKYNDDEKAFTFPNGSYLELGYCENENDLLQYQGNEYDVIIIEEATQILEEWFKEFDACVRPRADVEGAENFPKRLYLTCNPGGVGHGYVRRLFIDKEYRDKEKPQDYTFIQALVWDNEPLFQIDVGYKEALKEYMAEHGLKEPDESAIWYAKNNSTYVSALQTLPYHLREAWLNGRWDVFAGQYFGEFDRQTHTCEPNEVPTRGRKSVALDYGLDMLAVLWFITDEQGNAWCYRELNRKDLAISLAAEAILKESEGENIEAFYAPPDLWNRQKDSGVPMAETFALNGVPLIKTGNDRIHGWLNLKEWFKPINGKPRMMISRTCTQLIKNIPELRHDENKPNDIDKEPHEITHNTDALRYWCSLRQLGADTEIEQFTPQWEHEKPRDNDYYYDGEITEEYLI